MSSNLNQNWPHYWRQLQLLTANVSEGVIVIDVHQTIRWANSAALAMHGVETCDALGRTIDEYHSNFQVKFRGSQAASAQEPIDSVAAGQAFRDVVVEVTPLRGDNPHWVHRVRNLVLVDEAGNPSCIVLVLRPLSEERPGGTQLAETAGPQSEIAARQHAVTLCSAAPTPLHVLDSDMRILAVSRQWLEWLGYNNESVIGRRITEFMPASSASHFHDQTWKMLHHTGVVRDLDCQFIRSSGEVVDASVSARATLDGSGAPLCVVAAPVDITERKRSEARFAKLFALSPSPMVIRRLDDSRILDANDAFLAATGHAVESVVGHSLDDLGLFENRPQRQQFEHDLRVNGRVQNMDVRVKSATGDVLDCLVSADQIHVFGHPCAMLVLQDVTDRRRNEMQLFQAIETVMRDTSWFSRSVIEKLAILRSPPRVGVRSAEIDDLTPREREVLGLISHGLSDTDIAEKLGLTRSTVRNHVATLYSKIDVHSRSSAIVWARERGINIAWPAASTPNFIRRPLPQRKVGGSGLAGKDGRA